MEKRILGNTAISIAPLVFGGNVFGWTTDKPTSFRLLDHFTEAGFSMVDTADVYSNWVAGNTGGESETIIGQWMKERSNRTNVIIATKGGSSMVRGGPKNLSRNYIMDAVEASLRRLQTDYIDLYQIHYDDLTTHPEETLRAFATLVEQGKVRWIGASNIQPDRLELSLKISDELALPRYNTLQPGYNLYDREPYETELAGLCEKNNLSVLPYYSLASGFLTGKYRGLEDTHQRSRGERVKQYFTPRGWSIIAALDQVAREYAVHPATIALAWLLSRPQVAAPIASATTIDQLNDLLKAPELILSTDALDLLNNSSRYE